MPHVLVKVPPFFRWAKMYWRGDLRAIYIMPVLPIVILSVYFLPLCVSWSIDKAYSAIVLFGAVFFNLAVTAGVSIWWFIGSRRSLSHRFKEKSLIRRSLKALCYITVFFLFMNIVAVFLKDYSFVNRFYHGNSDNEYWVVSINKEKNRFEYIGNISYETVGVFEHVLDDNPSTKDLYLSGPGGRLCVAFNLAEMIRERHLDTIVTKECSSACTALFLGGTQRQLMEGAKLGFHGASAGGAISARANLQWRNWMIGMGVSSTFVERALATPPGDMWFPTDDELLEGHVITKVVPRTRESANDH